MSVLEALGLGIIQGITEFLPVSSFSILTLAESSFGLERGTGVLPEAMLHLGTALAIFLCFRKDFLRILREMAGMAVDLVGNIHIWTVNRRTPERDFPYTNLVDGTWRKLAALILISMVPTAILGYTARRLVTKAAISAFIPGACTLITGIFLLVTDLGRAGEKRAVREAGYDAAMWLGICQGISVFPGVSRCGLTMCAGLLCGLSKKFIIKFTYMMSVPACLGAFFVEVGNFASPQMTPGYGAALFLGTLAAAATGYFLLKGLMKIANTLRLRHFAYLNFLIGILILVSNYT